MADDERRAKIEVAARAMAKHFRLDPDKSLTAISDIAEDVVDALDRVRDTRGDDAATYPPDRLTAGEAPRPAEWGAWQSRSSQGEKRWACDACEDTGIDRREGIPCGCGARSPQDEDHDT